MKHISTRLFVSLLTTLSIAFLAGTISPVTPLASSATVMAGGCSWHVVSSPSIAGVLWGVSASSRTDGWAVGSNGGSAITEHWDGTHWHYVLSPQPGDYVNYLNGVVALSSNNVWAVGLHQNYKGMYQEKEKTFIENWDGSHWKVSTSPSPGSFYNSLSAVTAVSANDIWAVGSTGSLQGPITTLIEHWNGSSWSVVASPNVGTYSNGLSAVTALSSNDVWAVGSDSNMNYGGRTLTEHWNGSQWSVVPSPSVGSFENDLWSVAGAASNDVWAVGLNWASPGDIIDTLTEHWDGSQWSVVASPNPPGGDNDLHGVAVVASNNVWAVGGSASGPLTMQWDGHQWNTVPNSGKQYQFLNRIAAINSHDLWAVGSTTTLMMVMHYC